MQMLVGIHACSMGTYQNGTNGNIMKNLFLLIKIALINVYNFLRNRMQR